MANPYFNATYYLANNPDVFAAGVNTAEGAWTHYQLHGAAEALNGVASRSPAPWFDISYYLAENSDLATAGLTPDQLFEHFTVHGIAEGRQPSADANVNAETLAAYAAANQDLRDAFGIEEGEELTQDQLTELAQHFYANGYKEERDGKPAEFDVNPGETITIQTDEANIGTSGNDTFRGYADDLTGFTSVDGLAGRDTLNLYAQGSASIDDTVTIRNVEVVNLIGAAGAAAYATVDASVFQGAEEIWQVNAAGESIENVGANTAVGFRNTVAGDTEVDFSGATGNIVLENAASGNSYTISGDSLTTLNVSGSVAAEGTGADAIPGTLSLVGAGEDPEEATLETINLALTSDTIIDTSGAGFAAATTLDASASTGNLSIDASESGAGTLALETVTLGSGNDVVAADAASFSAEAVTLDLGAGNDTIFIDATADATEDAETSLSITLGAGADRFELVAGGNVVDAEDADIEANLITIEDFTVSQDDVFAVEGGYAAFATNQSAINTAVQAADSLSDALDAAMGAIDGDASFVQFVYEGTLYIGADNTLVELAGVSSVLSAASFDSLTTMG